MPRSAHLARLLPPLLAAFALSPAAAAPAARTMAEVLAASKPSDWRVPAPEQTLYMDLPGGRVVIELAPAFAPEHADNIRRLARQHYYDGLAIVRVHDNFVTQWGDADSDDASKAKPLGEAKARPAAEFSRPAAGLPFTRLTDGDVFAAQVGHVDGFPVARDAKGKEAWLAHCYGMVGAGRGNDPRSGSGAELYAVIGHAPRQLDRNIALVGRVIHGIELLSGLPRGPAPMGFYERAEQRVPITSVRLAADVPAAERMPIEVLRTDTPTFAALVESRRNRRDDWYLTPAGRIDLCNVPVPSRLHPAAE